MYPEFEVEPDHHLPYLCYNQYIMADGTPYAHGCIHLDQFLLERPVLVDAPRSGCRGDADEDIDLPGEQDPQTLATESGKKIIRTMFEAVWCLAKTGRCLVTLGREHIFVGPDGSARFSGVQISDTDNLLLFGEQLRQSLRAISAIGRDLFTETGLNVPPEFVHLFDMVDTDTTTNIDLYHVHASGVPIGIGWLLYLKIFDHVMVQITKDQRFAIYRSLEPYLQDWRVKAQANNLLNSTYIFRPGSYNLNDGIVAEIMGMDQNQFLSKTPAERTAMYKLADAHKFMTYLRNRSAHRLGGMDVDSFYKQNSGVDYTAEGSDYVTQIRWAEVVCHIQKELSNLGELPKLKISHLFSGLYPKNKP